MGVSYDFSGWATKNDLQCSDGRIIRKDAFKHNDGEEVSLVWNHQHSGPDNVIGHALLENRDSGVYAYCTLNDTEAGETAKKLVKHGDIKALSIYANGLKQRGAEVIHGSIREVSLVLAGANPGAFIDSVLIHGDSSEEEAIIYNEGGDFMMHSYDEELDEELELDDAEEELQHSDEEKKESASKSDKEDDDKEVTLKEAFEEMPKEYQDLCKILVGLAVEEAEGNNKEDSEGGKTEMKQNAFDMDQMETANVISHADQEAIMKLAKQSGVGSFRDALTIYAEESESLSHGAIDGEVLGTLLPDFKDVYAGEPETLTDDQSWIAAVINGTHKSPISRVRTRQLDARERVNRAHGYVKGTKKKDGTEVALLSRTTDPQTIYVKDKLNRDDIIDFTDFDIVAYQWKIMQMALKEEVATAILVGDGRAEGAEDKISETHIRSIWNDDELYTIHKDVDIAAAKTKLQGTDTGVHFSDNYVYAEAMIEAALYAREEYKGSGNLTFFCTPHLLNVMLLARDFNGRRIYQSKADLAAALNVKNIETVEQFEGLQRTDKALKKHDLLGIFVNLADYQIGSTKGGEITKFEQFDIDFNQQKMLIETRISGALTRVKSAIVLEMPATEASSEG